MITVFQASLSILLIGAIAYFSGAFRRPGSDPRPLEGVGEGSGSFLRLCGLTIVVAAVYYGVRKITAFSEGTGTFEPVALALNLIAGAAGSLVFLSRLPLRRSVAAVAAILAVMVIAQAKFIGAAQRIVTVRLDDDKCVAAPLLTQSPDGIYLVDGPRHHIYFLQAIKSEAWRSGAVLVVLSVTRLKVVPCPAVLPS